MVNPDQNDLNMQQDFDEFDNLVNDDLDMLETDYADDTGNRKKRQTVFYLVLFFMIVLGGGAAWFLFFRPADTVTPLPMPGGMPPAAESVTSPPSVDGLPPGVSTPEETAKNDLREATSTDGADLDMMPPALDGEPDQAGLPPLAPTSDNTVPADTAAAMPQADTAAPIDGTLAEALPPPTPNVEQAPQDGLPPAMPEAFDADTVAPQTNDLNTANPIVPAPNGDTSGLVAQQPAIEPIAAPAPVATEQPIAAAPVVPATPAASDESVQQLQTRLAEMETQVQTLNQELQQVRSAAPATGTDTGVSGAQLQDLTQKLDRLAQQVDALDQRTTTFATELQKRADNDTPAAAPVVRKAAPKAKAKPVAKKAAAPRKNAVSGWELRSAQPGVAWLGRQGASEMGRYAIGQNVPGLGTVQAVTMEGGRWIVKTTGGTLRQ